MIDHNLLLTSVKGTIDESLWDKYDFQSIINNAELCYDDTAVKVTASDFIMIFDLINYDLVNMETTDVKE